MENNQSNHFDDSHQKTAKPLKSIVWIQKIWLSVYPGHRAWRGAAIGVLVSALFIYSFILLELLSAASPNHASVKLVFYLLFLAFIGSAITILVIHLFKYISFFLPLLYRWILFTSIIIVSEISLLGIDNPARFITSILIITVFSLLGAAISVIALGGLKGITMLRKCITISGGICGFIVLGYGLYLYCIPGKLIEPPINAAEKSNAKIELLTNPDPSQIGPYAVKMLTYGSGTDRLRDEYGKNIAIKTNPVDGSSFIERWSGKAGDLRTEYWGFDDESLPLNGRVWHPDTKGPFPLAMIVHGNHVMEDFSDPGYDYLGELLASRGFIVVSIDENFLNLTLTDVASYFKNKWIGIDLNAGLKEENDLRGWLLLEHLRVWRNWNNTKENPFYQKIDMQNIALMGHSRGGEAVAIAACFNKLPFYPDDGNVKFDFNFNIKSVVAIAPVDGQYKPTKKGTPIENINYLVLHGSHDGDVNSFHGSIQYDRIKFTDDKNWMKCNLYIYGANHGQFNTTWGQYDMPGFTSRFFNTRNLLPKKEQEQIAKVYISAFLEATLKDQKKYIPLFRDYRVGKQWLPDTIYLTQYEDSTCDYVCTFEDDINLESTNLAGGKISSENLTVWKEKKIGLKEKSRDSNAVYLGWYSKNENEENTDISEATKTIEIDKQSKDASEEISNATKPIANYTIALPENGLPINNDSVLIFSLADAKEDAKPKNDNKEDKSKTLDSKKEKKEAIDFTIEVTDINGNSTSLPLSHFSYLQPQLEAQVYKNKSFSNAKLSEVVFQHFEFPLIDFIKDNSEFNLNTLHTISFIFDKTDEGCVILDNLGFREQTDPPSNYSNDKTAMQQ